MSPTIEIKELTLDVSNNCLGRNINALVTAFEFMTSIHTLNISSNALGMKGLTRLLTSLVKNDSISSLKLDNNFAGNPSECIEFISTLENFIQKRSSLRSLSIGGGSTHVPAKQMTTLLESIALDGGSLEELIIAGNMLGDSLSPSISNVLEKNGKLKSIDVDRNQFTINAYQSILLSLHHNHSLVHLAFPSVDFERAIGMLSTTKKASLFTVMHKIQMILDENDQFHNQEPAVKQLNTRWEFLNKDKHK
eukprot:gene7469-8740_t